MFYDKRYIRHFHIPEVFCPSLTFLVLLDSERKHMKLSWAICAPEDNFSRKVGRDIASKNMDHHLSVEGDYNPELTISQNIHEILTDGFHTVGYITAPRSEPVRYRDQAIQAMEEFHFTEATIQNLTEAKNSKKSLYWDRLLPILFKSKLIRKHFWGTD